MTLPTLAGLTAQVGAIRSGYAVGRVSQIDSGLIEIVGLGQDARLGDRLDLLRADGSNVEGEVLRLSRGGVAMLPDRAPEGVALDDRVRLVGDARLSPDASWIGRIVDPMGRPMDGRPLVDGPVARDIRGRVPDAARRRALGPRLDTGYALFNTILPIVRGQRIGLFAGSGVGKSRLLGGFARNMQADVVVVALIGERGRELRDFVEEVLGAEGMARAVVIAATSDASPLLRRRCAWAAMTVAEHFRDIGAQVLLLADSVTRFAEAHREVAIASGELPAMRGYPASTAQTIMSLCERAGPGVGSAGDITAIFTVLVAGSDIDEPVADILRGTLDGHVVLDRAIAERGRFPAIDTLRSVSRSLPGAATDRQNSTISEVRHLLGIYERSETMIRAGLYQAGSDPVTDRAIRAWEDLDRFVGEPERLGIENSFNRLDLILRRSAQSGPVASPR